MTTQSAPEDLGQLARKLIDDLEYLREHEIPFPSVVRELRALLQAATKPESPMSTDFSNPLLDHFFEQAETTLAHVVDQPVRARAAYFLQAERAFVFVDCALRCIGLLPPLGTIPVGSIPINWSHPALQRYQALQRQLSDTLAKLPEDTHARFMSFDTWLARTDMVRDQFADRYGRQLGQNVGHLSAKKS